MKARVQREDFDVGAELARLRAGNGSVGAVASFVGTVRDLGHGPALSSLTLEHYPAMTQQALESICDQARLRFDIIDCLVVHRYGELVLQDQIVLVAVTSAHRSAAFEACAFIMDYLKTQAPFLEKGGHVRRYPLGRGACRRR